MSRVMVVAGGEWQVPLIKKIKSLGHTVINTNLYENSVGFAYADASEVIDVLDLEKNYETAIKYQIEGVLTDQSDIAVPTVAYVAEKMGLPGIGTTNAKLFTNKYAMREFCALKGFDTPEFCECTCIEDAIAFFEKLNHKAIIKPVDYQASCGVYSIECLSDLEKYFPIAQQYSVREGKVIIERYIQGTEFTVDGLMVNGKHYTLAISEKEHYEFNENVANALCFSYDNPKYDYNALRQQHNKLIESTGIKCGITHTEYKYEDGRFYLIEMAARGGGTRISSDIVPFLSGIDNYAVLIETCLGKQVDDSQINEIILQNKEKCAELRFIEADGVGKRIKNILGLEYLNLLDGIVELRLNYNVGDVVQQTSSDRTRFGYYIICANNVHELEKLKQTISDNLKIIYE